MDKKHSGFETPGTLVLSFLLLAWIAFLWFFSWVTLAQAWGVR